MNFEELQDREKVKPEKGIYSLQDNEKEFYSIVYHKALLAANGVIKNYEKLGNVATWDMVSISVKGHRFF